MRRALESNSEVDVLRGELAELLGFETGEFDDEADLFELGLQSLQLMRLAARMQRAGSPVTFAELAATPRLSAWRPLMGGTVTETGVPVPVTGADPPAHDDASFPLTKVQQAYWIGRRDDQPLGGVGCHAYIELAAADVDPARFETAVRALFDHHPMLRARFDDEGRQQVMPISPWPGLTVHDLRAHAVDEVQRRLAETRERLSHRRFDVAAGAVMDVQLSLLPSGAARVHFDIDLLVADVASIRLLLDELAGHYEKPGRQVVPAPGFADQLPSTTPAAVEAARAYWAARIPGLPSGPALPLAVDPATVTRPRFRRRVRTIDQAGWRMLRQRARSYGITPAVLLASAFAEVLGRWSGSRRFLVNVPLFDRDQAVPRLAEVIGDFTNLVLLEIDLDAADSFVGRARAVQGRLHQDIGHAAWSGVDVLREFARADGDAPRAAPVVFACNIDAPLVSDRCARVLGELAWMVSQTPQVWLDHQLYLTRDGGLELAWDAVDELFPPGTVEHMLDAYHMLLSHLVDGDWSATPMIPLPAGQLRVREKVNSVTRRHSGLRLHERFFERAARTPDAPALLFGIDGAVSYGELADRALRIGAALAARGIGRGDAVVVTLPKGPHQIAAVLGVLAVGAAYVPVGVDQPVERRARIVEVSGARLAIAGAGSGDAVLAVADALAAAPLSEVAHGEPTDVAYVIFTSGSTGVPKGVEVDHRAAVNTIEDVNERFAVTATDRVLAISALDFDLSVWDVFGLLGAGGALVLVDDADRRDARAWLRLCAQHGVTVWNSVPALMEMLLTAADGDQLPAALRLALLSGDWIGLTLPARLAQATAGRCALVALGGATEGAIWSNAFEVDHVPERWNSIPYGRPLANQRYRVVDPAGRDCPDWVTGELWIGGAGVALGYRGAAELTESRFVRHDGSRWYRTGDLGRYWPDGTLEFLGRLDHQVKVNGNRVELGEVESVLAGHPAVAQAVAAVAGPAGADLHAAVVARRPAVEVSTLDIPAGVPVLVDLATGVLTGLVAAAVGAGSDRAGISAALPGVTATVLDEWLAHLAERGTLTLDGDIVRPGPEFPRVRLDWPGDDSGDLRPLVDEVLLARPLFAEVAAGKVAPSVLADDPLLSPDGLADALPGVRECVAAALRELPASADRVVRTVEWSGHRGRMADRVLRLAVGVVELDHTVLVSSAAEFSAATVRLAGAPGNTRVVLQQGAVVTQDHLHAYDVVLASGLLDEPDALAAVASLLRPGGTVLAIEQVTRTPLALLLTGLATGTAPRRPEPVAWAAALANGGLAGARVAHAAADGTALIVAHRPTDAPTLEPVALRGWLADRLPDHMVPKAVVAVPELPLSANAKIDRRLVAALLADATVPEVGAGEPPDGPTEKALAALWTRVLGVPSPGRTDAFFTLGGDSLLATRLVALVRVELGVELAMRDILRGPTLAAMATAVDRAREADAGMEEGEL